MLVRPAQIDVYPPPRHGPQRPAVVAVRGEVDASNADEVGLAATALFDELVDVVVDLRAVSFIASRGLWILTELPLLARRHGVGCAVVASPATNRLLRIVGQHRPKWVFDTADMAVNAVAEESRTLEHLVPLRSPPAHCS
ncbi:STAS domain-containing protein [Jongsikchunia kroppenstedtii]|uniref:STAS domain-containing protein n=1 Tax=Jongsikchunia kroppenstedtii TaxID=1121721 RepID=UPI00039AFC0B|nr:STAS domain-containing protein [Jongsikchunia kroppenstedtii]